MWFSSALTSTWRLFPHRYLKPYFLPGPLAKQEVSLPHSQVRWRAPSCSEFTKGQQTSLSFSKWVTKDKRLPCRSVNGSQAEDDHPVLYFIFQGRSRICGDWSFTLQWMSGCVQTTRPIKLHWCVGLFIIICFIFQPLECTCFINTFYLWLLFAHAVWLAWCHSCIVCQYNVSIVDIYGPLYNGPMQYFEECPDTWQNLICIHM